jgi:hypothetical protein
MYKAWTNNCTKARVHIPFSFYENFTFIQNSTIGCPNKFKLNFKYQAMEEKAEKKNGNVVLKHLRTNLAPSPALSCTAIVELLKECCAIGSAWHGVDLRFYLQYGSNCSYIEQVGPTWALLSVTITFISSEKQWVRGSFLLTNSSQVIYVAKVSLNRGGRPEARTQVEGPQVK